MFEDPAYPSMPPPGPDDTVKPMSIGAAALWAMGAQLAFLWIFTAMVMLKEGSESDLIGRIGCQVVGYGLAFYAILRVYGPETRIRDFLALRPTHLAFYPLALVVGVSATLPTYWLLGQIESLFPRADSGSEIVQIFYQLSQIERVAVTAGTVIFGPIVEEAIFRGALFRPLRQKHRPATVIAVTALCFAVVHLDPHHLIPLALVGAALGYVRWASGSTVPPLLLHLAFNAVPFVSLWQLQAPPAPDAPDDVSGSAILLSAVVCLLALGFFHLTCRVSRHASAARRAD